MIRFNPHPARRPGATAAKRRASGLCQNWFQSSPGQKAGCNCCRPPMYRSVPSEFQSSPGQKAGCNWTAGTDADGYDVVSILIRPEGRVQLDSRDRRRRVRRGFNPHPARRPGATVRVFWMPVASPRFQSSPGQKAGCNDHQAVGVDRVGVVSILTRPEGRVQLLRRMRSDSSRAMFQSSPGCQWRRDNGPLGRRDRVPLT